MSFSRELSSNCFDCVVNIFLGVENMRRDPSAVKHLFSYDLDYDAVLFEQESAELPAVD